MARTYNQQTIAILQTILENPEISTRQLYRDLGLKNPYKDFYNNIYRLVEQELVTRTENNKGIVLKLSDEGKKILSRIKPVRDGLWKLVIFDIPEKQKKVRTVLRAKLKQLHFQKWQNSIWVSPYALDAEIEEEFNQLAKHYFVRLIKTREINQTSDLEKLFK